MIVTHDARKHFRVFSRFPGFHASSRFADFHGLSRFPVFTPRELS